MATSSTSVITPSAPSASEIREQEYKQAAEATGSTKTERHFESNLGRLFSREEGESASKVWTIRVLSVLLVLPVVLTAIVDLGRGLGYLIGNVSPTVGKYFDGKSWSLIDKLSGVAAKVNSLFHSTPKELTLQDLNKQSGQAIESAVVKLIDGFRKLDGSFFTGYSSFSTPTAKTGRKQIARAKEELVRAAHTFLKNNATTKDYATHLNDVKKYVRHLIEKEAGDDYYIRNKVVREEPEQLLADKAFSEFLEALQEPVADQFVQFAIGESEKNPEPSFAQLLKNGVVQNILTPTQAKERIGHYAAPYTYYKNLDKLGLSGANRKVMDLLDAVVQKELVTQEEADAINKTMIQPPRIPIGILSLAAAEEVAGKPEEQISEAQLVEKAIAEIGNRLIAQNRLSPNNITEFSTQALVLFDQVKQDAASRAEAQTKAAAAAEAQKVAEEQQAANQTALLADFTDFLKLIAQKQETLQGQFVRYDALDTEFREITKKHKELCNTKVNVKNTQKPLLEAEFLFNQKMGEISRKSLSAVEKQDLIRKQEGFDESAMQLIRQLGELNSKIIEKNNTLADLQKSIEGQRGDIARLIATYKTFAKFNFSRLSVANQKTLKPSADAVFKTQEGQKKKLLTCMFTAPVVPNTKLTAPQNKQEVDQILSAYRASLVPPPAPPAMSLDTAPPKEEEPAALPVPPPAMPATSTDALEIIKDDTPITAGTGPETEEPKVVVPHVPKPGVGEQIGNLVKWAWNGTGGLLSNSLRV